MHSEDHFSAEGLCGSRFSKPSFKFTGKWKVQVPSQASVNKLCKQKICKFVVNLKVTNCFGFQENKNVRFISGVFS